MVCGVLEGKFICSKKNDKNTNFLVFLRHARTTINPGYVVVRLGINQQGDWRREAIRSKLSGLKLRNLKPGKEDN